MPRFHINPATGNANVCRAKIKCLYGSDAVHYATPELAREAFEVQAAQSNLDVLRGTKISKGAKILLQLDRAQQAVAASERAVVETGEEQNNSDVVFQRNRLATKLEKDLTWDDTDGPPYDDSVTVELKTRTFQPGEVRVGYDKDSFTPGPVETEVYRQMDAASAEWIRRLSTAEIKALVAYNVDADTYAAGVFDESAENFDPRMAKYLHSAVAKAPRSKTPFTVYAGISEKRCLEVRAMGETGRIDFNRIQSATVNPGQINAFMRQSDPRANNWKGSKDEVALEITTDRVASLSAFNVHKDEMEVLIGLGSYRVVEKQHDLIYTWDDGAAPGRKPDAETTYAIEKM